MPKVLFIDDEVGHWLPRLQKGLGPHGFEVIGEEFPERSVKRIKECTPEVVLLDILYHDEDKGKPSLAQIKKIFPDLPVVMITTTLMDRSLVDPKDYPGASYFFAKQELDKRKHEDPYAELANQLRKAIEDTSQANGSLDERLDFIVGNTLRMRAVAEQILQVAQSDTTVLITGESGTGKALVARSIHNSSTRRDKKFKVLDCGGLPETLLESELFGYQKGAFTGAKPLHRGIFEEAIHGTVFLDDVQNMSPNLQKRLLRILQEKTIRRLAGGEEIILDVRIIGATNENLREKIKKSEFREDLFYRLWVVEIALPPLRERLSDIPELYSYFVTKYNKTLGKNISAELKRRDDLHNMFQNHPWPGNIREFEHCIERAMVVARANVLTPSDFSLMADHETDPIHGMNVNTVVNTLLEKGGSWEIIRDTYKSGALRERILHRLIERLTLQNGETPTSVDLARILGVSNNNMRRILNSAGIKLKDFKKDRWEKHL